MARTQYRILDDEYPYFLTCTTVGWLPIFARPHAVELLLETWRYLQANARLQLYGYVVLENHLHCIAHAPELERVIQRFKSFAARQIIDSIREREPMLLEDLSAYKLRHRSQSTFQLWQEGSHPQRITSEEVMRQKLDYIHNNPVRRGYVDDPVHWRYSSARDYAGQKGLIDVSLAWW